MKLIKFNKQDGIRVYEIAKSLDVPSREVLDYLDFVGVTVRSASSRIGKIEAEVVKTRLSEIKNDFAPIYAKAPF